MKISLFCLVLILYWSQGFAQNIEINANSEYGLTINKPGVGLNVTNGTKSLGTNIEGGKAIFQNNDGESLRFRTNSSSDNLLSIYDNTFAIGSYVYSNELFKINRGRLKFTGSKNASAASGIEFTNASGTVLRGFLGMADDGQHLGLWGYGNNNWNVRINTSNGYLGIGGINPATRLHINGNIEINGLGHPLIERVVSADQTGRLKDIETTNYYQITPADFSYKSGTSSSFEDDEFSLYFVGTTVGSPTIIAPFNAPNGVTLKSVNFGFVDNNSSYNLQGCLVRVNLSNSVSSDLSCISSSGSASSLTPATNNQPISGGVVLDCNNYSYHFRLKVHTNSGGTSEWPGSSLRFIRANFLYDYLN